MEEIKKKYSALPDGQKRQVRRDYIEHFGLAETRSFYTAIDSPQLMHALERIGYLMFLLGQEFSEEEKQQIARKLNLIP